MLTALTASAGVAVAAAAATPAAAGGWDQVLHLIRRATYGPTPALVSEVRAKGTKAWLAEQLAPSRIADTAMDNLLTRWPRLSWTSWQVRTRGDVPYTWEVMFDLVGSHLARAVWSKRQLLEVMVDFWTNQLVIPTPSSEVYDTAHLFSRDVIRRHALGRYADMLWASAWHPSMLVILDNASSTKTAPNENYGRELLELHTVGIGGFTETDVHNSALAMTGLGIDRVTGGYQYKPDQRYVGALRVKEWSDPNASVGVGQNVAKSYISYLARHPLTARRLITKLCVRFVSDTPPTSLIDNLTGVYLANDTAMAPVLTALFTSTEFAQAGGQKTRTPYEDLLATVRALGISMQRTGTSMMRELLWHTQQAGQAPMGWPSPNGYPDVAPAWSGASSTVTRWNFHLAVAAGWSLADLVRPALTSLLPTTRPTTYGGLIDALTARFSLPGLSSAQRTAICTFLDKTPTTALKSTDPALDWRLPYVVALVLDSPNFTIR